MTWYAVLVGGPEASQNGLGERTPQKLMLRSGMSPPSHCCPEHLMDAQGSLLAVRDRIHNLAASVHAIAAGKVTRVLCTHGLRLNHNTTVMQFQIGNLFQETESALLPEGLDDHAYLESEFTAGRREIAVASLGILGRALRANTFQSFDVTRADDSHWHGLPHEDDAVMFRQLVFVIERGHLLGAAPIHHVDLFRAQPPGGRDYVNRGIARANDRNALCNFNLVEALALCAFDE